MNVRARGGAEEGGIEGGIGGGGCASKLLVGELERDSEWESEFRELPDSCGEW